MREHSLSGRVAEREFDISRNTLARLQRLPKLPLLYERSLRWWQGERQQAAPMQLSPKARLAEKTDQFPPCKCGAPRIRASTPFRYRRHLVVETKCKKRTDYGATACREPQKTFTIDTNTPREVERPGRSRYSYTRGFYFEEALSPICEKPMWSENPRKAFNHALLGKLRKMVCFGPKNNPHKAVRRYWSYQKKTLLDISRLQLRKHWLPWEINHRTPATCKHCPDPSGEWAGELLRITNAPWKARLPRANKVPKSYVNLQCRNCKRIYTYDRHGNEVQLSPNPRGRARYREAKHAFLKVFAETGNMRQASDAVEVSPSTNYWWRTYDEDFGRKFDALVDKLRAEHTEGQSSANLRLIKHRVRRKAAASKTRPSKRP